MCSEWAPQSWTWPLHGIVITNIVRVDSIQAVGRKESLILSNDRAIVLHHGGQCRWAGGIKGWLIRAQTTRSKWISCKGQRCSEWVPQSWTFIWGAGYLGRSGPNLKPGTMRVYVTSGWQNGLNIDRKVGLCPGSRRRWALGSVHAFSQAAHAANTYRPRYQVRPGLPTAILLHDDCAVTTIAQ